MSGGAPYKAKRRAVTADLPKDIHDKFEAIAREHGRCKTAHATWLIRQEIEKHEAKSTEPQRA